MANIDTSELVLALEALAKEKGINKEVLFSTIETALVSGYKKNSGKNANVRVTVDRETGAVEMMARKTVVEEVTDPQMEISLEDARKIHPKYEIGDLAEITATPADFGRIAAQTVKQVVRQHISDAESGVIYEEYIEKENEILTAIVHRVEGKQVYLEIGKTDGILTESQQMPGEVYRPGDRIKVYVLEVSRSNRGPQVQVSRTNVGLVKRLFEIEVPEIRSGLVQIKSIVREAGYRTKMAVFSTDPMIDPVGSCVGQRGMRVENVVQELKTEKIDIIKWSPDPAEYIANALNPARVINVFVSEREKAARVVVPDNQLSLAIGKEGQNARLAARLTGWKIDIKSQSQVESTLETDSLLPDDGLLPEDEA